MRQSGASYGGRDEFPVFPVVPILVYYSGEEAPEGYGWRAYKCPFHGDSSASASINTTEQVFNCHAADCPKGNAVQIIMKKENLDYGSAVQRAKEIAGESNTSVRPASGRSSRRAGGARSGSGARAFKRTWRSD